MRERVAQLNKHYYQGEIDSEFSASIQPQMSRTVLTNVQREFIQQQGKLNFNQNDLEREHKVQKKGKNMQVSEIQSLSKLIHKDDNYQSKPSNESSLNRGRIARIDVNSFSSVEDRNQYNELGVSHSDFGSEQFREEINQKRKQESVSQDKNVEGAAKKQKLKAKLDKVQGLLKRIEQVNYLKQLEEDLIKRVYGTQVPQKRDLNYQDSNFTLGVGPQNLSPTIQRSVLTPTLPASEVPEAKKVQPQKTILPQSIARVESEMRVESDFSQNDMIKQNFDQYMQAQRMFFQSYHPKPDSFQNRPQSEPTSEKQGQHNEKNEIRQFSSPFQIPITYAGRTVAQRFLPQHTGPSQTTASNHIQSHIQQHVGLDQSSFSSSSQNIQYFPRKAPNAPNQVDQSQSDQAVKLPIQPTQNVQRSLEETKEPKQKKQTQAQNHSSRSLYKEQQESEDDSQREQAMIQAFMRNDHAFYQKMIQDELNWQQQQLQKEFEKIQRPNRGAHGQVNRMTQQQEGNERGQSKKSGVKNIRVQKLRPRQPNQEQPDNARVDQNFKMQAQHPNEERQQASIQTLDSQAVSNNAIREVLESDQTQSQKESFQSFESQDERANKGYGSITQHVIKVYDRKNKQIQQEVIYFNEKDTPCHCDEEEKNVNNSIDENGNPLNQTQSMTQKYDGHTGGSRLNQKQTVVRNTQSPMKNVGVLGMRQQHSGQIGSGKKKKFHRKKKGALTQLNFPKMKIVVKSTKTISFDQNDDDDGSSSENKSQDSDKVEGKGEEQTSQDDPALPNSPRIEVTVQQQTELREIKRGIQNQSNLKNYQVNQNQPSILRQSTNEQKSEKNSSNENLDIFHISSQNKRPRAQHSFASPKKQFLQSKPDRKKGKQSSLFGQKKLSKNKEASQEALAEAEEHEEYESDQKLDLNQNVSARFSSDTNSEQAKEKPKTDETQQENLEDNSDESGEAEMVEIVEDGSQTSRNLLAQFNEYFSNTDLVHRLMSEYNSEAQQQDPNEQTIGQGPQKLRTRKPKGSELVKDNDKQTSQNEQILLLEDRIEVPRPKSGDDGAKQTGQLISKSDSSSSHGRPYNKDILGMLDEELDHHTELLCDE